MARDLEFLFEIHGETGDLVLEASMRASTQRQELAVRGARGAGTPLADMPIPEKYRWVPEATPRESPYNVAQLYAALGNAIREGKPAVPSFDAAVARHRMLDMITRAAETGQTQTA